MTERIKSGGAQWTLVNEAVIPAAKLQSGVAIELFNIPGGSVLQYQDVINTAWVTSAGAATLGLDIIDASDGSQLAALGGVDLETGGRQHVSSTTVELIGVAGILRAIPTLTSVTESYDVTLHMAYNVVGRANESVE